MSHSLSMLLTFSAAFWKLFSFRSHVILSQNLVVVAKDFSNIGDVSPKTPQSSLKPDLPLPNNLLARTLFLCHKTVLVSKLCESTEVKYRNCKIRLNKSIQTFLPDLPFHFFVSLTLFRATLTEDAILLEYIFYYSHINNPAFITTKIMSSSMSLLSLESLSIFFALTELVVLSLILSWLNQVLSLLKSWRRSVSHRMKFLVLFFDFLDLFFPVIENGLCHFFNDKDIVNVKCDDINGKQSCDANEQRWNTYIHT